MANFLRNLATRTLDQAPTIRPRLASIFEPAQPGVAIEGATPGEAALEIAHDAAPAVEPAVAARQPARTSRPRVSVQPAEQPQADQPPVVAQPSRRDPAATIVPAAISALEPARPATAAQAMPAAPQPAPPAPANAQPAPPRAPLTQPLAAQATLGPILAPVPPVRVPPAKPVQQAEHMLSATSAAPEHRQTPTLIERIVERAAQPASRPLQPAPTMPQRPATSALKPNVKNEPAPAAVPTINVTIGRIEVRATKTGAGAQAPRSAPEVMSLDEYLRRRSGGGQR